MFPDLNAKLQILRVARHAQASGESRGPCVFAPSRLCGSSGGCGGFSLVELMVVIGIVALLAGILLPTLSSARRRARRTQCMNNLKQVFVAHSMYIGDYPDGLSCQYTKDIFPTQLAVYDDDSPLWTGDWSGLWMGCLEPYLRDVRVYECPDVDPGSVNRFQPLGQSRPLALGYGWGVLFYPDLTAWRKRQEVVKGHEADHPLFMDKPFYKFYYGVANDLFQVAYANVPRPWWWAKPRYQPESRDKRHARGSNVCFYDGHVETLSPHAVWDRLNYAHVARPKDVRLSD